MRQNNRYFGMSPAQIGILASLTATACLLFSLAGWFFLQGSLNQSPDADTIQGSPISQFTATPWALPSPVPTGTATLIPYEALIPAGWSQHKTGLIEIWLPPEFEPGDPQLFNDSTNTAMRELVLTGFRSDSSLYRMLVLVSYEPLTAASIDVHLDGEVAKIPAEVHVSERRKITLNSTEAVRFMLETRIQNLDFNDVTYVFLDGSTVWYVEYIAQINEFFEMLDTFEKSAQTFRIVR
jgi:hypothetical protein